VVKASMRLRQEWCILNNNLIMEEHWKQDLERQVELKAKKIDSIKEEMEYLDKEIKKLED